MSLCNVCGFPGRDGYCHGCALDCIDGQRAAIQELREQNAKLERAALCADWLRRPLYRWRVARLSRRLRGIR